MDLGVLLESPQGSQSSSRVGICTCDYLPSYSSGVTLPFAWIKESVAFARGFPTRLSHEAFPQGCPTCPRGVSQTTARKSRQCRENRFSWNGLRHLGTLGMVARRCSSSRLSCGERLLLRCDGNAGNSFPTTQGKDPSSLARIRKRGSSGCGRDCRASSRVEKGMSGNFLSCSKGVKDPLEVPEVRCDLPRNASAETGLFSSGGENLLDVLELRQVLSTYDWDLRDPLWWPQERPVPM